MVTYLRIPKLGSAMTSAFVSEWYKNEGDPVEKGEAVVSVETDKIANDVCAEEGGVLLKIIVEPEEEREIGEAIGVIGQPGDRWE